MAFFRTLSIEVVGAGRNYPHVRLLLDGDDLALCLLPREGAAEELTDPLVALLDSGIDRADIWPHRWAVR